MRSLILLLVFYLRGSYSFLINGPTLHHQIRQLRPFAKECDNRLYFNNGIRLLPSSMMIHLNKPQFSPILPKISLELQMMKNNNYGRSHNGESRTSSTSLYTMSSEDIKAESKKSPKKKRARIPKPTNAKKPKFSREDIARAAAAANTQASVNDLEADLPMPSSKGIARLSRAVAKASAKRESDASNRDIGTNHPGATGMRGSGLGSTMENDSSSQSSAPKSLTQLTRIIDSQLYANGPRGSLRGDYPKIDGVVQNARDNMISLLGFNQAKGDWKIHSSQSTYNVAVVFGKELVRDQVTVEYASRIRTLARLFKNEPEFRPSLVCFCGGVADGSNVANSDAGYIFFRHMCEAQGIDLDGVAVFIDNQSQSDHEAIRYVTEKVKETYTPQWLEASPSTTGLQQKVIDVHFTLVSTEYHLCNINDVHHRSPEQSLFSAIEYLGEGYHDEQDDYTNPNQRFREYDDLSKSGTPQGIVKTSWSFQYATYPYIYAKDDSIVFLGKCFLLGEELIPLLVNMKAVVEQREFFQRDNYLMLASIRRSLVENIEALHKPSHSRKKALNNELRRIKDGHGNRNDVITILEGALLSLGRCCDLVKPAGLHVGSVSKQDWKKALLALEHSMNEIRFYCDPDRPLLPSEWGKLIDDDGDENNT